MAAVSTIAGLLFLTGVLPRAPQALAAAAPVGLGTAADYSVLGGQTVTNTGPSTLDANLGVSPGTAYTGFPPGTVGGAIHAGDAPALQAQNDLTTAYNDAAGRAADAGLPADMGGLTLVGGVYQSSGPLGLTGTLTLNAQGDANAVWIFQASSTLITASASNILLVNGAQACNVYWQVGSSATLGTNSDFVGTTMALTSITATTGTDVQGRALARNGAVTLDDNTFTTPDCDTGTTTTTTTTTTETTTTTTPAGSTTSSSGASATTSSAPGLTRPTHHGHGVGGGGQAQSDFPTGSGLAYTGASTPIGPLIGTGALLLALGGLLFALARTRRT